MNLIGTASVTGVALAAATAKTLLQLVAPTNQRLALLELCVSFAGVSNTDQPVLVELLYQSTAGTSSALTPVQETPVGTETLQATALQTFTAEPTTGGIVRRWTVHPQSGLVLPMMPELRIGGGQRLGLRCTAAQIQSATAYFRFAE
jgi:hypothetical protein